MKNININEIYEEIKNVDYIFLKFDNATIFKETKTKDFKNWGMVSNNVLLKYTKEYKQFFGGLTISTSSFVFGVGSSAILGGYTKPVNLAIIDSELLLINIVVKGEEKADALRLFARFIAGFKFEVVHDKEKNVQFLNVSAGLNSESSDELISKKLLLDILNNANETVKPIKEEDVTTDEVKEDLNYPETDPIKLIAGRLKGVKCLLLNTMNSSYGETTKNLKRLGFGFTITHNETILYTPEVNKFSIGTNFSEGYSNGNLYFLGDLVSVIPNPRNPGQTLVIIKIREDLKVDQRYSLAKFIYGYKYAITKNGCLNVFAEDNVFTEDYLLAGTSLGLFSSEEEMLDVVIPELQNANNDMMQGINEMLQSIEKFETQNVSSIPLADESKIEEIIQTSEIGKKPKKLTRFKYKFNLPRTEDGHTYPHPCNWEQIGLKYLDNSENALISFENKRVTFFGLGTIPETHDIIWSKVIVKGNKVVIKLHLELLYCLVGISKEAIKVNMTSLLARTENNNTISHSDLKTYDKTKSPLSEAQKELANKIFNMELEKVRECPALKEHVEKPLQSNNTEYYDQVRRAFIGEYSEAEDGTLATIIIRKVPEFYLDMLFKSLQENVGSIYGNIDYVLNIKNSKHFKSVDNTMRVDLNLHSHNLSNNNGLFGKVFSPGIKNNSDGTYDIYHHLEINECVSDAAVKTKEKIAYAHKAAKAIFSNSESKVDCADAKEGVIHADAFRKDNSANVYEGIYHSEEVNIYGSKNDQIAITIENISHDEYLEKMREYGFVFNIQVKMPERLALIAPHVSFKIDAINNIVELQNLTGDNYNLFGKLYDTFYLPKPNGEEVGRGTAVFTITVKNAIQKIVHNNATEIVFNKTNINTKESQILNDAMKTMHEKASENKPDDIKNEPMPMGVLKICVSYKNKKGFDSLNISSIPEKPLLVRLEIDKNTFLEMNVNCKDSSVSLATNYGAIVSDVSVEQIGKVELLERYEFNSIGKQDKCKFMFTIHGERETLLNLSNKLFNDIKDCKLTLNTIDNIVIPIKHFSVAEEETK